jgi:hypothetical protein
MDKVNKPISPALCRPSPPSGSKTASRDLPIQQTIRHPATAAKASAMIHCTRCTEMDTLPIIGRSHTLLPIV